MPRRSSSGVHAPPYLFVGAIVGLFLLIVVGQLAATFVAYGALPLLLVALLVFECITKVPSKVMAAVDFASETETVSLAQ